MITDPYLGATRSRFAGRSRKFSAVLNFTISLARRGVFQNFNKMEMSFFTEFKFIQIQS